LKQVFPKGGRTSPHLSKNQKKKKQRWASSIQNKTPAWVSSRKKGRISRGEWGPSFSIFGWRHKTGGGEITFS